MAGDHGRRAAKFLQNVRRGKPSLESTAARSEAPVTHFERLSDDDKRAVEGAVAKLERPEAMERHEQMAMEAIIIPDHRPAILIQQDDYKIEHRDWLHLNDPAPRAKILPAIPAIGRLEIPSRNDIPYGGTAFLVGPGLLMTNRHVAELFIDGAGRGLAFRPGAQAQMNFVEEEGRTVPERYAITGVVLIHPYWDMAILRVADLPVAPLILATSDLAEPEDIVVLGYPALNARLDRAVQDKVFGGIYNVKRLQPGRGLPRRKIDSFGKEVAALTHDASTLGGNSGSAVVAVASGEVQSLHFGGAYLDINYAVPMSDLARDAQLVDAGLNFAAPRPPASDGPWTSWWRGLETPTAPTIPPAPAVPSAPPAPDGDPAANSTISVTVPLTITVSLGNAQQPGAVVVATPQLERATEPWHDVGYADRNGYDPDFLGIAVPPPEAVDPADLASLADGTTLIPYMHFSIAMHAARRIALFTAANVSADPALRKPDPDRAYTRDALGGLTDHDTEKWFADPRLRGIEQLPDRFFTKDRTAFDKGHLVRRDDVAWGRTYEELRIANGDTFHVTNCSPQVARFNRPAGVDNWGDLEKAVLDQAVDQRLSVFSGPVLADDDALFHGVDDVGAVAVRIPRAYWKLVVAPDGAGLAAYAFLLEQDLSGVDMEALDFDAKWQRQMIAVADLEAKIAVRFPDVLHDADRSGTSGAAMVCAQAGF